MTVASTALARAEGRRSGRCGGEELLSEVSVSGVVGICAGACSEQAGAARFRINYPIRIESIDIMISSGLDVVKQPANAPEREFQ
jgi:hypothetical protein